MEGAKGFIGVVRWAPFVLGVSLTRPTTPQKGSAATPGVPGVPPSSLPPSNCRLGHFGAQLLSRLLIQSHWLALSAALDRALMV